MKRILLMCVLSLLVSNTITAAENTGRDWTKRIVFEKNLFADGVNPKARHLDELMVKFFDEDMVRLRNGELVSTIAGNSLSYTKEFLSRHPEIKVEVIMSMPESEYTDILRKAEERSGWDLVDLFSFYRFRLPAAADNPHALLADILRAPEIETAYYEPIPYETTCQDLGSTTPNFIPNQTYHDPAPLGTDLDYAQAAYGADVTDGSGTGTWCGVIETWSSGASGIGYNIGHEDWTNPVNATPENAPDNAYSHAAGVGGVMAACDDNGVGVVGYLADETVRFYDINALASIASVYTRVMSDLVAGEVCNSSWGYFSDPMPPGQSCPCNPGQNGMVPPEYSPSVKAAIQGCVADGIHVFMGTGNGCTNLDDATFGTTFRNSTDTGSNYIGGLQSAVPHDYICYTGFGERVDLCGWSENVYSCGYGSAFSGTGSAEWYASGFNGTSSASPIVAGCAGVVNNVYRDLHAGANIAPLDMRYYLNDYGTVPNSQPGNIGVMPNLRGVLAPELNPKWPTGWDGYAVPRNTNDATGSYAPLPTNLNSTPSNTYWNAAVENTAPIGTANGADWRVYRDDVWIVVAADNFPPNSWHWFENVNFESSTQVRGGRHAVRLITDYDDVVVEADETNNANTRQFVWDPVILTDDSPVIYSRPPVKTATGQSGSDYNCDGFARSTSAGYWEILAVQSATSTADYDARIYSEAVTSTNGFDTYEEWSAGAGNGYIDFVGINNNIQAGTLLASVVNYDGETADYSVEVQGSTVLSPSTPAPGRNNYGSFSIGGDELFEVWEFYGAASTTYTIEVDVTSGSADMVISVFGPSNDYFSRNQAIASSNANNGAGDEVLTFTPADAGWYGIVVHKDDYNDWQQNASFNLYVGQALSDMTHALRSGWSHQIVVRQSSGGDPAVLPATLDGNISTNYVNASYINQGGIANTAGVVRDSFYVDGKGRYLSNTFASWAPGTVVSWYNLNLGFIFGGRHSVGDIVDALELEPEWIETNNRHDEQFVWSPYPISNLSTYGISAAPNYLDGLSSVYFTSFNVDAFQFIGTYWSGVGMTPQDPDDEYNCYLYAAPTTSTSGLSTRLVNSWATGSNTEWVLENGNINGNPATYNVGVNNNWPWPGTPSQDSYRIWQSNSITDLNVDFVNGPYTLPNNGLIHVFDLYLTAGETTRILLDNQSAVDLGFAIYDPMVQYASRVSGGSVVNVNADGLDEALEYTPANSGYHGLVVFKQDYTDMPAASYRLIIGNRTPMPPTELTLLWVQHSPSVHECLMTWDPVTQDIFGNPLTVDTYDLYYTLDPSAEYNTGWLPGGSVPGAVNQTPIYIPDTWEQARFIFVARDEDGLAAAIIGTTGDDSRELLNTLEELPRRQDGAVRLIRSDEHR